MSKLSIIIILIILIVGAVYLATSSGYDNRVSNNELGEYFGERMAERGIASLGAMPIEGFDADFLMGAFPSLVASDFRGVETFEGYYEVANGEVQFVRDRNVQSISTAERTISSVGFGTLLSNLSTRLNMKITTKAEVDAIVESLDTSERLELKLNESGTGNGVTVAPLQLLEDSRCPLDVECIQAGTVRVRATLVSGLGTATQIFILGEPITTEGEQVILSRVLPDKESTVTVTPQEYIFIFEIKKR